MAARSRQRVPTDGGGALRLPQQKRSRRSLDRLLEAAEVLIAEGGVAALTLAALLQRSSVSNGAFYGRFSSLEALVEAVQDRALQRLEASIAAACEDLRSNAAALDGALNGIMSALFGAFKINGALFAALLQVNGAQAALSARAERTHARIEKSIARVLLPHMATLNPREAARRIATVHIVLAGILKSEAERSTPSGTVSRPFPLDRREMIAMLLNYLQYEERPGRGAFAADGDVRPPADTNVDRLPLLDKRVSGYSRRKIVQVLAHAEKLFTRQGFAATTMEQVAAEAGVGKATVYAHFHSKVQLFAAVIAEGTRGPVAEIAAAEGANVEVVLKRFAEQAFELILSDATTARIRMIASEAQRLPELAALFYELGPARLNDGLARYLRRAMRKGQLRKADAHLAAVHFLTLICGDLRVRRLIGSSRPIDAAEARRLLRSGVETFLRAYRPEPMSPRS